MPCSRDGYLQSSHPARAAITCDTYRLLLEERAERVTEQRLNQEGRLNEPPKGKRRQVAPFSASPAASPKRACLGCPQRVPGTLVGFGRGFPAVLSTPRPWQPAGEGHPSTGITFSGGVTLEGHLSGRVSVSLQVAVWISLLWSSLLNLVSLKNFIVFSLN